MNLSSTQRKLFRLLSINCRYSNRDIAKAIRASPDTVQYQTDKLIEEERLGRFVAVFDCRMLGYKHHHYFFRTADGHCDVEKLAALPFISFIMCSMGKYDYQIIILARGKGDLARKLRQVREIIGIPQEDCMVEYRHEYAWTHLLPLLDVAVPLPKNQKSPLYALNRQQIVVPQSGSAKRLDDTDKAIIKELLEDPRAGYLEIGRRTQLSHETVRKRIIGYAQEGFILSFGIFPDYARFGYFTNYLLLKLKDIDDRRLERFIREKKYVFYAARLSGEYNLIVYTYDRTPAEFASHAREIRSAFGGKIQRLELLFFESTEKYVQFPEELLSQSI